MSAAAGAQVASSRHAILLILTAIMPTMGIVALVPVLPLLLREFASAPGSEVLVPVALTIPALCDTQALVFTLGGAADKRAVFDAAARGKHDLPVARLLREAEARGVPVTVFT